MDQNKLLSIITVNLNNFEGLKRTVNSVLNQVNCEYEYLIIDGLSSDQSKLFIDNLKLIGKVRCIVERDNGIYDAMNKGINLSNGNYLLFLNSGDYFYSNTVLEKLTKLLNRTECDVYYSDVNLVYKDYDKVRIYPENLSLEFWSESTLNHQSTVIKKEILNNFNKFSLDFKLASDFNFYLSAFMTGKIFFKIPFIISNYDMNGISSRSYDLLSEERIIILNNLISPYFRLMLTQNKEYELLRKYKIINIAIYLNNKWQYFKKTYLNITLLY